MKIRQKPYKRKWAKSILEEISKGRNYSVIISSILNKSQPNIFGQLRILKKEGFIIEHRGNRNNKVIYKLSDKGIFLLSYFKDNEILENKYNELLK